VSVRKFSDDPKDDRYWVRVYNPQGRDYRKIVKGKRAADAHEAEMKTRFTSNDFIDPHAGKTRFRPYAEAVINSRNLKPGTRVAYLKACDDLLFPKWGDRQMKTLRHSDAVDLTTYCEQNAAPNTAYNALVLVRSIMRAAVLDGVVARNPFAGIKMGSRKYKPKAMPTWDEVSSTVDATTVISGALITAFAGTGVRGAEMCGLAVSDIDWLHKRLTVHRQIAFIADDEAARAGYAHGGLYWQTVKSDAGQGRVVPLPDWAVEALSVLAANRPEPQTLPVGRPDAAESKTVDLLLPAADPANMSARIAMVFRNKTGTRHAPHSLRHLYTTTLEQGGVPLRTVQSIIGHEPQGVTLSVYAHVTEESLIQARQVIGAAWPLAGGAQERAAR
jgi:integrase